eukprot:CAMPEP_0197908264 /NCGR_PEP_ID=MMETSP1439-20131203/66533_1 /TAXON_ID=66791 /ORGANISM="Gonyaulax spinifera, Strain CCMP409" /LENGTH=266 /DNA_ID=CAMNT_0043529747 /DNA_START=44 /DNA_END=844 /DNA_ORIENTATION=+
MAAQEETAEVTLEPAADEAAAEPDADGLKVQVNNLLTGALVANLTMGAGEDCATLKTKLSDQTGHPPSKIRLVMGGDALANSWCPPSDSAPLELGLCIVHRTNPEHSEPLPLKQGNYWSDNATPFDDGEFIAKLLQEDPSAELASVQLTQSEGCVWGVSCEYRCEAGVVPSPPHDQRGYGWYAGNWPEREAVKLELAPGERIVRVVARAGEIVDRLELHTDLGQSIAAGGEGGSARRVDIEQGAHVIGFSGHRNGGVLVRLGFHVM